MSGASYYACSFHCGGTHVRRAVLYTQACQGSIASLFQIPVFLLRQPPLLEDLLRWLGRTGRRRVLHLRRVAIL
jgi:hypothetical protein